jgi:cell division septation protein DedD
LTWQTLTPNAVFNALGRSATDTPAAAPTAATSESAAASEATAASEAGAASDAIATLQQPTASEALQQPVTPATVVEPPVTSKTTPGAAEAAPTASAQAPSSESATAPSAAAAPEPLPKVAVKGLQWVNTLPKDSFLIEHGQFSKVTKAQQLIQSKAWLTNARIVPVYERDQGTIQFSVLTGPFRSQERAQTFKSRQELPSTSKIRSRANVLALSQAPGSKTKQAEKNR